MSAMLTCAGGPWLRDDTKLDGIVKGVRHWGSKTGWPVSNIVDTLMASRVKDS